MLRGAVICMLDCKQSELGTGRGSYAVILLVSPLVSLTIAKFIGLSEHCYIIAQFCMYTTFKYFVRILFHVDKLSKCYHFTAQECIRTGG